MLHELLDWPEKIIHGTKTAKEQLEKQRYHQFLHTTYSSLLFVGMGGSGIAGSIFRSILEKKNPTIAVSLITSPHIPNQVPENSIAFVSSYSGNTWEVLDAYDQLKKRNIPTIVLTYGGELKKRAEAHNDVLIIVPQCSAPRASLGSFVGIVTTLCYHYGFLKPDTFDLNNLCLATSDAIKRYNKPELYDSLIHHANNRTLICIGVSDDSDPASYRAQTQFNENSKIPAIHQNFPEFCHNGIVGITGTPDTCHVLFMHTKQLSQREKQGLNALHAVLDDYQIPWYAVDVHEEKWEFQLFELIIWADFASFYLGKAREVDITAVAAIDTLKQYFKSME